MLAAVCGGGSGGGGRGGGRGGRQRGWRSWAVAAVAAVVLLSLVPKRITKVGPGTRSVHLIRECSLDPTLLC